MLTMLTVFIERNGRVLSCGHEICAGASRGRLPCQVAYDQYARLPERNEQRARSARRYLVSLFSVDRSVN